MSLASEPYLDVNEDGCLSSLDQKAINALYAHARKGSSKKFSNYITSFNLSEKADLLFKCHVGENVVEHVDLPHPSSKLSVAFSELVVPNPTFLAIAVIYDHDTIITELAKLKNRPEDPSLVDVGNEVFELNLKGEVEWRAIRVTPLIIACMLDKFRIASQLLSIGADVNAASSLGRTSLHEACFQGNLKTAELCISYGCKINVADNDGVSPLMLSCARGAMELMKLLLAKGANTRQQDKLLRNALFYTLPSASIGLTRQIIKADRNCYVRDCDGLGAFLTACMLERFDMVRFFIDEADSLGLRYSANKTDSIINERDPSGRSGLHIAAENGSKQLYTDLVMSGISCDPPDKEGRTPLMYACLSGNLEFVKFLIEENPGCVLDKLQRDYKGRNAVYYAITSGHVPLLQYLYENDVPFELTPTGLTPLMQAAGKNKTGTVQFLVRNREKYDIDLNACDVDNWNAAMYSVSVGDLESLEELINAGAELTVTSDGRTLLMESAFFGSVDMTNYIIGLMQQRKQSLSGGIDQCDIEGWNAAMYALAGTDAENAIQVLTTLKTNANLKPETTKKGVTALMEVALKGSVLLTNYLLDKIDDYGINLFAVDHEGANALSYSALGGSLLVFQALLKKGLSTISDTSNRNVLMLAAARDHIDLINYIAKNADHLGVDMMQQDKHGRNALFYACDAESASVVETLLNNNVPVCEDNDGVSLLMSTADHGNEQLFTWLLSESGINFDLNAVDSHRRNVLFYALQSLNVSLIENVIFDKSLTSRLSEIPPGATSIVCKLTCRLLNEDGDCGKLEEFLDKFSSPAIPLNVVNENGQTPLYLLVAENKLKTFKKFACYYDPKSAALTRHKVTLLMHACASSLVEVAKLLLVSTKTIQQRKELLHAKDSQGRTALTYGVVSYNVQIVRLLIEHGATLTNDQNRHSALTYAVQARHLQLSLLLLNSVLTIPQEIGTARDGEGNQLLHYCARYGGTEELVNLIIKRTNADINARTTGGCQTALMIAVACNNLSVTKALVKAGCSITACDADGDTALHVLFSCKGHTNSRNKKQNIVLHLSFLKILLSTPASHGLVSEPNKNGLTPLMLACIGKHAQAAFLLLEHGALLHMKDNSGMDVFSHCKNQAEQSSTDEDQQFYLAFHKFLQILALPSPAVGQIIQAYKEDIITALAGDDDENKDGDGKITNENIMEFCRKKSCCIKDRYNYIFDDASFLMLCNVMNETGFTGISAVLKSKLYETKSEEYYV